MKSLQNLLQNPPNFYLFRCIWFNNESPIFGDTRTDNKMKWGEANSMMKTIGGSAGGNKYIWIERRLAAPQCIKHCLFSFCLQGKFFFNIQKKYVCSWWPSASPLQGRREGGDSFMCFFFSTKKMKKAFVHLLSFILSIFFFLFLFILRPLFFPFLEAVKKYNLFYHTNLAEPFFFRGWMYRIETCLKPEKLFDTNGKKTDSSLQFNIVTYYLLLIVLCVLSTFLL